MGRHVVCEASEIARGERKIVTIEGKSIGIFNVEGRYYALRNRCPHQGAELCKGPVGGLMLPSAPGEYRYGREGEIIRCPWHGWEFDLTSGQSIFDPPRCLVKTYEVTVEHAVDHDQASDRDQPLPAAVESYPVDVQAGRIVLTL